MFKIRDVVSHFFRKSETIYLSEKSDNAESSDLADDFLSMMKNARRNVLDPYRQHSWVANTIDLIARNISRASFEILRDGKKVENSPIAKLFSYPNESMSLAMLWKETASEWSLNGECFWWFGKNYVCGIPKEIILLKSSEMTEVIEDGKIVRWIYSSDDSSIYTILPTQLIHFKDWNPWNKYRGVSPLVSLGVEIEQDLLANKQISNLLKEGGVPKGLLKTDQILTEDDAEILERRWQKKFFNNRKKNIAVLGKGTEYQKLTFSPDELKLYEVKKWNLYSLLARYGVPPRVANIQDAKSSLSGTDTGSQHAAFWNFTLIPLLQTFEQILDVQLFKRLGLKEIGKFDLSVIPELQESEDSQSNRDIAEIGVGLKTINDVLEERGKNKKPWGDTWYRASNLVSNDNANEN